MIEEATASHKSKVLMNLIEFLREKLTPTIEQKISRFLGESQPHVSIAVQSALPTILGGLIQQGTTEAGAQKVMDIIKDGGHTGDVLNNMADLLDNYDKSRLLVTIGSNIFGHFFGNTASTLTDKVANLSGIKNLSAESLLGLLSPVVLGAIGYVVHKENLGVDGLKKLLNEQREDVSKALPPLIAPHLPLRSITPVDTSADINEAKLTTPKPVDEVERNPKSKSEQPQAKRGDKSFANTLLPWLFLIILALLSAYYLRSCRVTTSEQSGETSSMIRNDTTAADNTTGFFGDSAMDADKEDSFNKPFLSDAESTRNSDNENVTTKSNKTPPANSKVQQNPARTPVARLDNASTPTITNQRLSSARSWIDLSPKSFKPNSAEVQDRSEINTLASYLKQNPNATIEITPAGEGQIAEDRAYALREQLYQKGIDISRIYLQPAWGSGDGVSIKVNR